MLRFVSFCFASLLVIILTPLGHAQQIVPPTFCPDGRVVYGVPCPPSAPTGLDSAISPPAGGGMPTAPSRTYVPSGTGSGAPPPMPRLHGFSTDAQPGESMKVLSYFQRGRTRLDTTRAFGFVLLPRPALTAEEAAIQLQFCQLMLASMDFMTPGGVAARSDVLATYWPMSAEREWFEIRAAFEQRSCPQLLSWYDHGMARTLAANAGVSELSGPLLITWPSGGGAGDGTRDPLVVDFSRANYGSANKTLRYWFRELRSRPDLWTDRIREGTIRAELADAINESAGVMMAVLYGKWEALESVNTAP